jgi:hypothetical protein
MPAAHLVEYILCRPGPATRYILEPLAECLEYVGTGGNIEKPLVGFRVLHYGCGLSFHCENDRAFALLELFH